MIFAGKSKKKALRCLDDVLSLSYGTSQSSCFSSCLKKKHQTRQPSHGEHFIIQ